MNPDNPPEKVLANTENESTSDLQTPDTLFMKSDSFKFFKEERIAPPNQNAWTKVLFELGPDEVEKHRLFLGAFAKPEKESKKSSDLAGALARFHPETARQVAKISEDEAEEKYGALVEEVQTLRLEEGPMEEDLQSLRIKMKEDMDMGQYVDEVENKILGAKNRIQEINRQLDMMEAVFYISDEITEKRFASN